jgi:hypothetical protein
MAFPATLQGPSWAVLFCRPPGRDGGPWGPATKWRGRRGTAGHAAVPPAVARVPAAGGVFFPSGGPSETSGWIEWAGPARLAPAKIGKGPPLRLEMKASHICPFEGVGGDLFPLVELRCGTPDTRVNTGDLCGRGAGRLLVSTDLQILRMVSQIWRFVPSR